MNYATYLLAAVLLLTGCGKKGTGQQATQTAALPDVAPTVVAIGRVEPESKITSVGSEVNGVVKHLFVKEGDSVKRNEVLVELVHDYEDAQLQQAQTKLATQKAEIENVKAQLASF